MIPFPGVSGNRIQLKPAGYLKAILAALLIIAAIALYVFQFSHFDKILNIQYFLLLSVILGILLGILLGRHYAANEDDMVDRMRIYMVCTGIAIVFMPLMVSLMNRYLDFRSPQTAEAQILELRAKTDQPFGYVKGETKKITNYKSTILIKERIFKIKTKVNPFVGKSEGEITIVPIRPGLLGIAYLDL